MVVKAVFFSLMVWSAAPAFAQSKGEVITETVTEVEHKDAKTFCSKKDEADAAAQTAADKSKFDAFQAQRMELRLQQRMIKVFAQQRAMDSARAKATLDAAVNYGLSIAKDEKRRLLQRLPQTK